jgi:hypothetical protein
MHRPVMSQSDHMVAACTYCMGSIVSKGAEETFVCRQKFIVKIRIPVFGCTSMIYSRTERRGNRLVAREAEREGVCAT